MNKRWIEGGITAPKGFVAAGVASGIKTGGKGEAAKDLALIFSSTPCVAAGTFTSNRIKAAPVRVSQAHLRSPDTHAILANSGNANACTGAEGIQNARRMAAAAAAELGVRASQVLVASTGRIGVNLPIEKIEKACPKLVRKLAARTDASAARAIMTSDTVPKEKALSLELPGGKIRLGGIAKGAGMINPNMATMLCFLSTDANINPRDCRRSLTAAVEQSFNRITVDGDMSTNDTVFLMANGASGVPEIEYGTPEYDLFEAALTRLCVEFAKMIVLDGECATKFVEVSVKGATTFSDASKMAQAIANSLLVKCALYGEDPNWGRILDAAGYSGGKIREEMVDLYFNGLLAVRNGVASGTPVSKLRRTLKQKRICITLELHLGKAEYTAYTTDLSPGYVKFNMGE